MDATISDPSTWKTTGKSATDLLNDAVNLIGTLFCGLGYGVAFTLYCICAQKLYAMAQTSRAAIEASFMLVYTTIMTLCGGLYFASVSRVLQLGYVNFRNHPQGPYAYTLLIFSSPIGVLGLVTYFIVNWMAGAMLIWRVFILYKAKRYPWAAVVLPCSLYLGSVGMSVILIHQISRSNGSFRSSTGVPFALGYYVLASSSTTFSTVLIALRLMLARKQYHTRTTGLNTQHAKQYLGITTMVVESSVLYAVWSIISVGLFATNHPIQNIFLSTSTDISIIALLMIVYRMSEGKAWKVDTEHILSTGWRNPSTINRAPAGSGKYIRPSFGSGQQSGSATGLGDTNTVETYTGDDSKKRMTMDS